MKKLVYFNIDEILASRDKIPQFEEKDELYLRNIIHNRIRLLKNRHKSFKVLGDLYQIDSESILADFKKQLIFTTKNGKEINFLHELDSKSSEIDSEIIEGLKSRIALEMKGELDKLKSEFESIKRSGESTKINETQTADYEAVANGYKVFLKVFQKWTSVMKNNRAEIKCFDEFKKAFPSKEESEMITRASLILKI